MRFTVCCLSLGVLIGFSASTQAADWPQWRGPQRDGISSETRLLKSWPTEGPKPLWQVKDIGDGYSTPAVVGDRLYVVTNQGVDDETVKALSITDGSEIWTTRIGKVGPNQGPQYPGSRSTPTVDGRWLYVLGSDGDLVCMDAATGNIRWQTNVRTDYGGQPGAWAYSESPLVDGDVLVCSPGGADATMLALDKHSGKVIWKCALPEADQAGYASVIVIDVDGHRQYVQFLEKGLVGVDTKTGKLLWRYAKTAEGSPANIPTPVAQNNLVYSAASRSGCGLVKLTVKPDGTFDAEQVYFTPKLPSGIGGAVLIDGNLYGTTRQGLLCVDFASGEIKWQERSIGAASICVAEDRLYLHGENGDLALVEARPDGYHEVGRFTPPDQPDRGRSQAWAYPVISNGKLYIRDLGCIWCYDIADPQAGT